MAFIQHILQIPDNIFKELLKNALTLEQVWMRSTKWELSTFH